MPDGSKRTAAADFVADQVGSYVVQVSASGVDRDGNTVQRSAEHVLVVADTDFAIAQDASAALIADVRAPASRLSVRVPYAQRSTRSHVRAYAQLWGANAAGKATPVAWMSGMVASDDGALELGLDPRWLARAGVRGGLWLQSLRVEDADTSALLAQVDQMPVDMQVALPVAAAGKNKSASLGIDETMLFGVRPEAPAPSERGVGTKLMLVHGYCSGAVWPAANFSNAATFLDANQNRSHDAFALLMRSYGNQWNSFGVVAHSQGGAAATHLFTYYWSGLDNATGARLIQSVGTPYKGTNLAGVLAAVGGVFGVGCGFNNDLTYGGAANWLAGIPQSSRVKVHYHTTSFKNTGWWTNDFCNFATDLVLADPEDGTTEQVNGQLSGANNRGHVTGQCHVDNMRDPAQYRDTARNSTMNSNAAR